MVTVGALLIGAERPSKRVPAAAKQTGRLAHRNWCVVYQLAAFGLQNNKKRRKKRLGEARKQVAEGATLKLVKEKSEKNGSNRNDLSQKRVLFLFAEGDLTASYSFLRGIVQARLPSALVSYVISLRSVLR